jgi:hypothetical protein
VLSNKLVFIKGGTVFVRVAGAECEHVSTILFRPQAGRGGNAQAKSLSAIPRAMSVRVVAGVASE